MKTSHPRHSLTRNIRFYILVATVCLSVLVVCWLRLTITSDQLFLIRAEQIFGYLCVIYWYVALLVSPLQKQIGGRFNLTPLVFSRRAIGVSAAYFALLHTGIALWGQIDGPSGLVLLPERFVWSISLGVAALVILLAMAATSFNKVIAFMTFRKWKWLHRLGYIGGTLALIHLWMIGTHMAYSIFQSVIFVLLIVFFWLESLRMARITAKKYPTISRYQKWGALALWLVLTTLLLLLPRLVASNANHHATPVLGAIML